MQWSRGIERVENVANAAHFMVGDAVVGLRMMADGGWPRWVAAVEVEEERRCSQRRGERQVVDTETTMRACVDDLRAATIVLVWDDHRNASAVRATRSAPWRGEREASE